VIVADEPKDQRRPRRESANPSSEGTANADFPPRSCRDNAPTLNDDKLAQPPPANPPERRVTVKLYQ